MKREILYTILSLAVLSLTVVPIGTAVFLLGFVQGDSPCVMCWEQRTGMALIALIGLFVLRYGPRPRYVGSAVLVGAWGIFMGLRHTGMHAARDVGQGFSIEIFGAHTYTWSLFIFWICVVTMGGLLLSVKEGDLPSGPRILRPVERLTASVFLIVIAANIVQAFASTGPPPFMGQGDPVRFSFNPRHWVWSLEEWSLASISLRGRWAIEKPDLALVSPDPAAGPLVNLPELAVRERRRITLPLRGTITDLAYDSAKDRFFLTTQAGVYIVDGSLTRVLRYTIVDPGYSVDLGRLAAVTVLGSHTIMALGENKSYVILDENDQADLNRNFRYFLESRNGFDESSRSRLGTVRARLMYVMSLAFDATTDSLYTVTVPNSKVRRMVISRFARRDGMLSEEFTPSLSPDSGLRLSGEDRSPDELYVTGAAIADGRMYAISAAFATLVTIDLRAHSVVAAYTIRNLVRPTGIALRGSNLYIVGDAGDLFVVERPPSH